ncbi:MAG: ATP-binding cassette domain-containing protein [Lachnospirales bacterium]
MKFEFGKSYAIVGLNGSGKTTLIKILSGLYSPNAGEIFIDGKLSSTEELFNKNLVSVIFQDYNTYPLAIKDNIGVGDIYNINNEDKICEYAALTGAHEFIDKFEYKYNTKLIRELTDGIDLSSGQWQKIALTMALISDRPILILDEPTASLDAKSEYEVFSKFKELTRDKTSILVSHKFSTVKNADVILVLNDGVISEKGTHGELMEANGLYSDLYKIQIEILKQD